MALKRLEDVEAAPNAIGAGSVVVFAPNKLPTGFAPKIDGAAGDAEGVGESDLTAPKMLGVDVEPNKPGVTVGFVPNAAGAPLAIGG